MLTIITGAPGSGKSAATVEMLMKYAAEGRPVYVNNIPELKVAHVELSDEEMRRWPETVPDGSVVVVDEAQRIWPAAGAGAKVPADLAALNTHRHRGLDFIVVTQFPKLLHVNVRAVCGRYVHLRDVGMLGRWWYEWPELTDPSQFRSAPIKRRYTLPKRAFEQYRSASMHIKPPRALPPSLVVLGLAVVALVFGGVKAYGSISAKVAPQAAPAVAASTPKASRQVVTPSAPAAAPAAPAAQAERRVAGCITFGERCTCIDSEGWPVRVEWEVCQTSSRGFGGVVALNMEPARSAPGRGFAASAPADVPKATSFGFNAGDYRDRAPLPHVRNGGGR